MTVVCFIGAHLDDAVLSAGQRIADAERPLVVTVFTDAPTHERTDGWNHDTTGRSFAPDTQAVRRDEDADALALLDAEPRWLGGHEAEYQPSGQDVAALTDVVRRFLTAERPDRVFVPLGIHHADHIAVSDACLALVGEIDVAWSITLDMPYGRTFPREVTARLAELDRRGLVLVEQPALGISGSAKHDAVHCYATQVEAVRGEHPELDAALLDPERTWWITHRDGTGSTGEASTVTG